MILWVSFKICFRGECLLQRLLDVCGVPNASDSWGGEELAIHSHSQLRVPLRQRQHPNKLFGTLLALLQVPYNSIFVRLGSRASLAVLQDRSRRENSSNPSRASESLCLSQFVRLKPRTSYRSCRIDQKDKHASIPAVGGEKAVPYYSKYWTRECISVFACSSAGWKFAWSWRGVFEVLGTR